MDVHLNGVRLKPGGESPSQLFRGLVAGTVTATSDEQGREEGSRAWVEARPGRRHSPVEARSADRRKYLSTPSTLISRGLAIS